MQEQLAAMFGNLGGGPGGGPPGMGGPGGEGMPDFQKIMAQMMGMDVPPSQNLLGDMNDPAGLGGAPSNPFANSPFGQGGMPDLGSLGGFPGMGGMGMPGMGMMGGGGKTKVDKYFPLVHFASIVVLALFSVVWWEPALRSSRSSILGGVGGTLARWAGLAGGRGVVRVIKQEVLGGIEVLVSRSIRDRDLSSLVAYLLGLCDIGTDIANDPIHGSQSESSVALTFLQLMASHLPLRTRSYPTFYPSCRLHSLDLFSLDRDTSRSFCRRIKTALFSSS